VPQQLLNRLYAVYSDDPWRSRVAPRRADWPVGRSSRVGTPIPDVRALVVHETSGWPTRNRGEEMFYSAFLPGAGHSHSGETTQLYVAGDGTVLKGMDLPLLTWHATFVNGWAIGAETGHGWGNYRANDYIGPFTSSDETRVPDPAHPGERMKGPTYGNPVPLTARTSGRWVALSGDGTIDDAGDDDLPGIKFFIRHQGLSEVIISSWITARYAGPWRQTQRVPEMLFTEAQYRSWALLARWVAEEYLLPRNFPVLPHKSRSSGLGATGGLHGMIRDAASFSAIVLADEALSRSPQTFLLPAGTVLTAVDLQTAYSAAGPAGALRNPLWQNMFNVYRGLHGHGFSGDPDHNNDHDCPGPMFDWHRFAREVSDWQWWPFDVDATAPDTTVVPARPYSLASRDGNTRLGEYFWSTPATRPAARARVGVHGAAGSPRTFELPQNSRIYAISNGDLVAARFPTETDRVSLAFMLVRHEVYHRLDTARPNPRASPPVFANRIDYDLAPTTVYSLYMHLGRPAGISFDQVVEANPDWLNRLLARKKECELGVAFRNSRTGRAIDVTKWDDVPPSSAPTGTRARPTLAAGWAADNDALALFLTSLRAGTVAVAPLDPDTTSIRILLGDYLAQAGIIRRTATETQRGVRVEVFANSLFSNTDFILTDNSGTGTGWAPLVAVGTPAVRYASEWARIPAGAERATLMAAGVDPDQVNWWRDVQPATLNTRLPADAHLAPDGNVIHYDPMTFLPWINQITWRSEWPKYRATDPAGIPAAPRPR
jgi:hypothetical protein